MKIRLPNFALSSEITITINERNTAGYKSTGGSVLHYFFLLIISCSRYEYGIECNVLTKPPGTTTVHNTCSWFASVAKSLAVYPSYFLPSNVVRSVLFNVPYQGWSESPSSFIQAWDWHCQSGNSVAIQASQLSYNVSAFPQPAIQIYSLHHASNLLFLIFRYLLLKPRLNLYCPICLRQTQRSQSGSSYFSFSCISIQTPHSTRSSSTRMLLISRVISNLTNVTA